MADGFDPYYKWLAIPPEEQPPNHYRLLGTKIYESDPDVIETAADLRMTHIRTFQTGRRAAESQQLLTEIAKARGFLLDPEKKTAYDAQLKKKMTAAAKPKAKPAAKPAPKQAHPILLKGTVSGRSRDDEDPPIFVDAVKSLADVRSSGDIGVCIELRKGETLEPGAIERLRGLLAESPGNAPLLIAWRSGGGNGSEPPLLTSQSFAVSPSRSFLSELRELMGDDRVRLIRNVVRR